jgi:hypothetical protein
MNSGIATGWSMRARLRLVALLLAMLLPCHGAAQAWLAALGPAHHHRLDDAALEQDCCAPEPPAHHHEHSARHHHAADDDSVLLDHGQDHDHPDDDTGARAAGSAAQPALPVRSALAVPPGPVSRPVGLTLSWRSLSAQPPLRPPITARL